MSNANKDRHINVTNAIEYIKKTFNVVVFIFLKKAIQKIKGIISIR